MSTKAWMTALSAAGVMVCVSGMLQAGTAEPSQRVLASAVTHYLSDHGDLCVGKFTWPRVVTPEDRQAGTNDAVQLPVLERLGLVQSTKIGAVAASSESLSYSLTPKGRRFYLQKKQIILGAHGHPMERDEDLCAAHLRLDRVVKWTPPEPVHGHLQTQVRYTYHIKSADWMADPEARKVFPVVDRIIRGQGNLLMSVTVQQQDNNWVPVLPSQ